MKYLWVHGVTQILLSMEIVIFSLIVFFFFIFCHPAVRVKYMCPNLVFCPFFGCLKMRKGFSYKKQKERERAREWNFI